MTLLLGATVLLSVPPSDATSSEFDRPLPSFSVAIAGYNQGRYLRTALASVQDHSHPAAEIIVVDDRSTNETAAVAAKKALCTLSRSARSWSKNNVMAPST